MKNIIFYALVVLFSLAAQTLIAQAPPQKMTYQFVARNGQNQLIQNNAVGLRISILQGSTSGAAVYVETHTPQTNGNGTATIEVGAGTVVSGIFANIDWSTGVYFIQTEMDPQGQQGYSITAVSQLLSVPYAFYAGRATYADSIVGGMNDADSDPTNELQTLTVNGDSIYLSGGGGSFALNDADTSLWKVDNFGIHYNQGNVGIGNDADSLYALNITKNVGSGFGRYFLSLNNTSTSTFSNVSMRLKGGVSSGFLELTHYSPNYTAIPGISNYGGILGWGNGLIFNVPDSLANFRFVRGGGNNTVVDILNINRIGMGIGTSNPTEKMEINGGGVRINGYFGIGFSDNPYATSIPNGWEGAKIYYDNTITGTATKDYLVIEKKDGNATAPDGGIVFANRGNNGVRIPTVMIDGTGNLGVGTITPTTKLQVTGGDVYIENIATGIIMKSPNGNCWRVTVDNIGNLVRTAITCP